VDFALIPEQLVLRETIVRFARERLNPGAAERDRTGVFPQELWLACGELGLQGLPVPEDEGGAGLDAVTTAMALEALGYGCEDGGLVFAVSAHLLSCVVPIWKHGTAAQRQRYLPDLCRGRRIGVHAMTEPGSGSDAFGLATVARPEGDGFRIDGTKTFISNGSVADLVIVFALTDRDKRAQGGITAFLVERGVPGFSAGTPMEKLGLRTAPLCELVFDGVRVPPDAVLGGVGGGARVFTQAMDWERALLFAGHVGTMERLLERAVAYARTRTQFGQRIGKFQAVSHRIADMKVRLDAAKHLVYRAAWELEHSRAPTLPAAVAKLFASEALLQSALDTIQVLGGYGFTAEYEVERVLRDSVGGTLYSGTSEMQRNLIAGWLGL
jgi:hypothetical protein